MLSFLVIGEWGRRGARVQRRVADGMVAAARHYDAEFVISTGDNFGSDGVSGVLDPHWHDSFDAVYDAPELDVPWYASLGDGDYRGDVEAQVAFTKHDVRWHLPDRFYAVNKRVDDRTHAQFVFLDTTPFVKPDADLPPLPPTERQSETDPHLQLYWLRHMLAPSRSRWKVVVGHHPLDAPVRTGAGGNGATPSDDPTLRDTIGPVLEQFGVQAYLCGHEHVLLHEVRNDLHQVVSGAGAVADASTSAEDQPLFAKTDVGFAVVTLDADAMTVRFCNADGEEIYAQSTASPLQKQAA